MNTREQLFVVQSLENICCAWEDFWYLTQLIMRARAKAGHSPMYPEPRVIANWQKFRDFILGKINTSNTDCFLAPPDYAEKSNIRPGHWIFNIHWGLMYWAQFTRRVYSLNDETKTEILSGAFGCPHCSRVHLPLQVFAVQLESPTVDGSDFALVLYNPSDNMIHFWELRPAVKEYIPIDHKKRNYFEQLLQSGSLQRIADEAIVMKQRILSGFGEHNRCDLKAWAGPPIRISEQELAAQRRQLTPEEISTVNNPSLIEKGVPFSVAYMFEIVLRLASFLSVSTVTRSTSKRTGIEISPSSTRRVISKTSEIYTVSRVINHAGVVHLPSCPGGNSRGEMDYHVTRGYFRRKRGTPVDAPKDIWIDSYEVHPEKRTPGELPPGAKIQL